MIAIPLLTIPSQTFDIVLDDQECRISLYWKQVRMYIDLTVNGTPVIVGGICENGVNITQGHTIYFTGTLHFIDLDGVSVPRFQDFGSRYLLVYYSAGEELPHGLRW